jgi:hypothetical protein
MRWSSVLLVVALAGCSSKAEDECKRLASRLMPDPKRDFIDACVAKYKAEDRFVKVVECLLDVEGDIYEKDIDRCGGKGQLPLYFQF